MKRSKQFLKDKFIAGYIVTADDMDDMVDSWQDSLTEASPVPITAIWSGSQAQYDAIATKDANTLYHIV